MEGQPYAVVEVEASGFPENISVVIEVHVLLYTSDGTAKGINVVVVVVVVVAIVVVVAAVAVVVGGGGGDVAVVS